jgi:hypothetical protein
MADTKANDSPQAAPAPAMSDAERAELQELRAMRDAREAELAAAADAAPKSETIPGGAYLVNDVLVNAEGQPIDSKGNVKKSGE